MAFQGRLFPCDRPICVSVDFTIGEISRHGSNRCFILSWTALCPGYEAPPRNPLTGGSASEEPTEPESVERPGRQALVGQWTLNADLSEDPREKMQEAMRESIEQMKQRREEMQRQQPEPPPGTDAETGEGLNNLDYAYIAGELGKNPIASECLNCSAPDTGNMEVLERVGTPEQKAIAKAHPEAILELSSHFAAGSMLPKVQAACEFATATPGKRAAIGGLTDRDLGPGEHRLLTLEEVRSLYAAAVG